MSTQNPATSEELLDRTDPTRFELYRNGQLVGELAYRHLRPNRYALLHTEVLPDHRGQGVGSALVKSVLEENAQQLAAEKASHQEQQEEPSRRQTGPSRP